MLWRKTLLLSMPCLLVVVGICGIHKYVLFAWEVSHVHFLTTYTVWEVDETLPTLMIEAGIACSQ